MSLRKSPWTGNSHLTQAVWVALFDPLADVASVSKKYGVPLSTLRRYMHVAKTRDPAHHISGVIWDWDPATFRLPPWPPSDGEHPTIEPTPYARAHAGKIAPQHGRSVRGFAADTAAIAPPAAKKRKVQPVVVGVTGDNHASVPELSTKRLLGKVRFTIGPPPPTNLYLNDRATIPDVRPVAPIMSATVDWSVPELRAGPPDDPVLAAILLSVRALDPDTMAAFGI